MTPDQINEAYSLIRALDHLRALEEPSTEYTRLGVVLKDIVYGALPYECLVHLDDHMQAAVYAALRHNIEGRLAVLGGDLP